MGFKILGLAVALGASAASPALAQQSAGATAAAPVITRGGGRAGNAPGFGAPGQTSTAPGATATGGATAAQPQVPSPVFPPVENIVPGSEGAVVFPPAESITGVGGTGQTVLPPVEQTVQNAPGGFPFTNPNITGGVQSNLQQGTTAGGAVVGTGIPGVALGTTQQQTANPLLNRNRIFTTPGTTLQGQTGALAGQLTVEQSVFPGGVQNQGFSVGGTQTLGGAIAPMLPAVPMGLGPGSRPGAENWVTSNLEPYDADEPDALDFSRSP